MRHLFVTNDFPPKTGGIESYVTGLCRGLEPEDVSVVAPSREGHQAVDAELPYHVERVKGTYLRASGRVLRRIEDVAVERDVDVIHFLNALPLGRLAHKARRSTGKPVTVFAHGSEMLLPARMPLVRRSLRKVLIGADLVVVPSEFTAKAVGRFTRHEGRIEVVYPPVDPDRFSLAVSGSEVRSRFHLGSRFVIVFVSRLVKRKGAEILVRAMPGVARSTALIVGSGPEEAALKRLVRDLDLSDRVAFAGRVPDEALPSYYAAGDVFCMPCTDRYGGVDTEGFGIVYLEAAASGLPVVAGSCGGSVEAVRDGVSGILLSDPNPPELASTLKELRDDEALRARLGAAGREWAERISPPAQATRLDELVEEIVSGSGSRSS